MKKDFFDYIIDFFESLSLLEKNIGVLITILCVYFLDHDLGLIDIGSIINYEPSGWPLGFIAMLFISTPLYGAIMIIWRFAILKSCRYFLSNRLTINEKLFWLRKPGGDLINNTVKALLLGIIFGVLFGFTGEYWDFDLHNYSYDFKFYGTSQAILGGVLVTLALFLLYNKKD
jgi:hypothetical protein